MGIDEDFPSGEGPLSLEDAQKLLGKYVVFWYEDTADCSEEAGSMAGWVWKTEVDEKGFMWIVTDDGWGVRADCVSRWEEDLADCLPHMYPYMFLDKYGRWIGEPYEHQ